MDSPLLEPISADAPCGEDLSYDPLYNDLAVLVEGTPENQFEANSAKEPNWLEIRKLSEGGLKRSKDLQMAVYYTLALMKTAGMDGAARGMELTAGIVRKYWDNLFPNLDPEDPDPTQRVNILSQLTVEQGSYGDPIKFIERLGEAPIFKVPGLAVTITFLTHETTPGGGTGSAKLPEILASANPEESKAGIDALRGMVASVHALDDFLIEKLGRTSAPSFDPLIKILDKGLRLFDGLAAPAGGEALAGDGSGTAPAAGGAQATARPGQAISGDIRSLDDVRKTLAKIREFYAVHEPASPVPLLLLRAERLVGKNFLDLLANLAPNSRSEFDTLLGPEPEGS